MHSYAPPSSSSCDQIYPFDGSTTLSKTCLEFLYKRPSLSPILSRPPSASTCKSRNSHQDYTNLLLNLSILFCSLFPSYLPTMHHPLYLFFLSTEPLSFRRQAPKSSPFSSFFTLQYLTPPVPLSYPFSPTPLSICAPTALCPPREPLSLSP